MSAYKWIAGGVLVAFTLACTGSEVAVVDPPAPVVENVSMEAKAATIAKAVAADPSKADEALATAGITAEEFEALMFEIAMDPARSKEYMSARGM